MTLKELLEGIEVKAVSGNLNISINGISYDSRKVKKGDLFICIQGFKSDGHRFISQAINNGAVAIMVEKQVESLDLPKIVVSDCRRAMALIASKFYGNPSSKLKLIGITGTNGKTTTTYLIKSILEQQGSRVGLIGTNQNMIGDKVIHTERTTPESLELQELFAKMVESDIEYVVMEVSSHSIALNRVEGCDFTVGVFTNITQDHLDFHKTMEEYLKTKTDMFKQCQKGIVNADDPHSAYVLENGNCAMITFAIKTAADIKAENIELSAKGVKFEVEAKEGKKTIELGIPGEFSVYNALGSIGACLALGIEIDIIQKGLKIAKGVPGRAQIVQTRTDFSVLIDYAHTPDGLENILKAVKGFAPGRIITLFGCGGDRDRTKRPIMGMIAGEMSDFCILTSDNPRTEDPMEIIYEIEAGVKKTNCPYTIIEDRRAAIEYAIKNAQKDDLIVLAGKGHETYQVIGDKNYPFDENEIVQEIVKTINN